MAAKPNIFSRPGGTWLPRAMGIALWAMLLAVPSASATVYQVHLTDPCADFNTIQAAVNVAITGDTIIVATGHYIENVDFRGCAVTMQSTDPCNAAVVAATIIDAGGSGIAVSFHNNETAASVLRGFTITGGRASYGSGICCWGSASPSISDCVITGNNAESVDNSCGAGIYLDQTVMTLRRCVITENEADKNGGGIYSYAGNVTISDCVISNNQADQNGGGVFSNLGFLTLNNTQVNDNTAKQGGGYYSSNATAWNTGCTFNGNSVLNNFGGGVRLFYGNYTFTACQIDGNSAYYGGGLYHENGTTALIGTTLCDNTAINGAGIYQIGGTVNMTDQCAVGGNTASTGGGGLYVNYGVSTQISLSAFYDNIAAAGAGIYCNGQAMKLYRCNLQTNRSGSTGGAIHFTNGTLTLMDNLMHGNTAGTTGSAVYCSDVDNGQILHNDIIGNRSDSAGGALVGDLNSTLSIRHNIVAFNTGYGIDLLYTDEIIEWNNLYANSSGNYHNWAWPGTGDISVDPCFVFTGFWSDPCATPAQPDDDLWLGGDYRLRQNSPCIHTGDPAFAVDPTYPVDYDGTDRIIYGRVDIGAIEAVNLCPGDFNNDGIVNIMDRNGFLSHWLLDSSMAGYDSAYDLTADDTVNLEDWAVFSKHWNWLGPWLGTTNP